MASANHSPTPNARLWALLRPHWKSVTVALTALLLLTAGKVARTRLHGIGAA